MKPNINLEVIQLAKVIPFQGYTYNEEKIDDLGKVMAPPYDAITPENAEEYRQSSEYNSIRLVLPTTEHGDDIYSSAGNCMQKWVDENILVRDKTPAIYLYEQSVISNGELRFNRGFIGLLELTDYSEGIVTHCEEPSTDSKNDRFDIIKATQANASMISCMYVDKERKMKDIILSVCENNSDIEFEIDGLVQRVWKIDYEPLIDAITDFLKEKLIYIVDGHNRYEAALEYKKSKMQSNDYNPNATYNYILAHFCEANEGGKSQLPYHRLVKFPRGFREEGFTSSMQDIFKIEKIIVDTVDDDLVNTMRKQIATQRKETKIALFCGGNYFYRLTLKDYTAVKELLPDKSDVYCSLDITVLNKLIFENIINITDENMQERVFYTRSASEGVNAVDAQEYGCMFMLNPVKLSQISEVTLAGEKMPKRSVCIFPKPATGVVIHKFYE